MHSVADLSVVVDSCSRLLFSFMDVGLEGGSDAAALCPCGDLGTAYSVVSATRKRALPDIMCSEPAAASTRG